MKKYEFLTIINSFFILTVIMIIAFQNDDINGKETFEEVHKMGCSSDSMGVIFGCDDIIHVRRLKPNDKIIVGDIYVYNKTKEDGSHNIIHRIVFDLEDGTYIFKGDNNLKGERVNRSDITFKVLSIEYKNKESKIKTTYSKDLYDSIKSEYI